MMGKLVVRNVRRSARDYGVYFLTLMLAVAMFYAFNALTEQKVLFDSLSESSQRMFDLLSVAMGLFSGVIAFALAFLIVYANRFLLKRRKREFGMYLTLGMGTGQVARVLVCETALVGLVALAVGLVAGIAASQGMAFVTAALMGTTMSDFRFIVSGEAVVMTLLCFAAIFVLSALVNVVFVSRRKLADLVNLHESNETQVVRNPVLSAIVFVLSVACLGIAYWQLKLDGLVYLGDHFVIATALMIIGTVGFFWSVSGFVLLCFKRSRKLRYRGLASFTLRQITSKVNIAFASMAVVCVMLFFSITVLAGGLAMVDVFVGEVDDSTRFDATIASVPGFIAKFEDEGPLKTFLEEEYPESYDRMEKYGNDAISCLSDGNDAWDELVKDAAQLDYYQTTVRYADLLDQVGTSVGDVDMDESIRKSHVSVISISQFNRVMQLEGEPSVDLAPNRFLVNNCLSSLDGVARDLCDGQASMEVADKTLTCCSDWASVPMRTSPITDVMLEIVVPDDVVDSLIRQGGVPVMSHVDIMYRADRQSGDELLRDALHEVNPTTLDGEKTNAGDFATDRWPVWGTSVTALEMIDQASGMRMVITYLAVYLGFVFLLTTATVLAIQQLSEVTDSLSRYRSLSRIGVDPSAVFSSLRVQTCTYFLAPLALAICHSACALWVLSGALGAQLGADMVPSIVMACCVLAAVYMAFLLVTYFISKSMVKQELL